MRQNNIDKLFIGTGLLCLVASLVFGLLGAVVYIWPQLADGPLAFTQIRPLHVSLAIFWILFSAIGAVYGGMHAKTPLKPLHIKLALGQFVLMVSSGAAIVMAYLNQQFGGREYFEFPPHYAIFIATAFVLFFINYLSWSKNIRQWPVYMWMWLTGILFFIITFAEGYLWLLPGFSGTVIKDLTAQWKAGGSIVGSWNMLVYGAGIFIMEKVSGSNKYSTSLIAYWLYFLGLTNLMFNWGHHIYVLPTAPYIRYVSYAISMTEWVILARIIYLWKKSMAGNRSYFSSLSVRFLHVADIWILLNLGLAILMSIPGINIYTHGTHVTVAHAMGTTIGINTMILLAGAAEFMRGVCQVPGFREKIAAPALRAAHISLLFFWLALIAAGIQKAVWIHSSNPEPFSVMMKNLAPYFWVFGISGLALAISLGSIAVTFIVSYATCIKQTYWRKTSIGAYRQAGA